MDSGSASTVAAPGNSFLSPSDWMSLHQEYAARARRRRDAVVFLGDSMIYFWGDPLRKTPPGMLGPLGLQAWEQDIAPDRAANFGVMGDQTQNLLWRVQNGELAGRPRVAVVLVGVNNLLQGQTPGETAAGVSAVVSAIRAASPRTRVLLLGLLPPDVAPGDPLRVAVDQVNAQLAGLAGAGPGAGGMVTYLDPGAGFIGPGGSVLPGLIQPDNHIHPTPQGYSVLAQEVEPVVRQLLGTPAHGGLSATRRKG
jgi:beta-glucosidase